MFFGDATRHMQDRNANCAPKRSTAVIITLAVLALLVALAGFALNMHRSKIAEVEKRYEHRLLMCKAQVRIYDENFAHAVVSWEGSIKDLKEKVVELRIPGGQDRPILRAIKAIERNLARQASILYDTRVFSDLLNTGALPAGE